MFILTRIEYEIEPEMKVADLYFFRLASREANVPHALNMAMALGKIHRLTFITPWAGRSTLREAQSRYGSEATYTHLRLPIGARTRGLLEFPSMLAFSCLAWLYIAASNFQVIYTCDFAFIYFLSFVPKWMRPKAGIVFEAHKIYHIASKKVSFNQENS